MCIMICIELEILNIVIILEFLSKKNTVCATKTRNSSLLMQIITILWSCPVFIIYWRNIHQTSNQPQSLIDWMLRINVSQVINSDDRALLATILLFYWLFCIKVS